MNKKIMSAAPIVFGCIVILCAAFLCLGICILPDEKDEITMGCEAFESDWYQVFDNGEKHQVEVPGEIPAKEGELVKMI